MPWRPTSQPWPLQQLVMSRQRKPVWFSLLHKGKGSLDWLWCSQLWQCQEEAGQLSLFGLCRQLWRLWFMWLFYYIIQEKKHCGDVPCDHFFYESQCPYVSYSGWLGIAISVPVFCFLFFKLKEVNRIGGGGGGRVFVFRLGILIWLHCSCRPEKRLGHVLTCGGICLSWDETSLCSWQNVELNPADHPQIGCP